MATIVRPTALGGPEVLELVDEPAAAPGPGQVTVAVRAAGVNPMDLKLYSGQLGDHLPTRLGLEAAGVVTAVGPDAPFAVGDEVIAYPAQGTYATEVTVDAEGLTAKPAGLGFDEAAGLLLTGATAVNILDVLGVGQGETLLVHGGAGGVGLMTVQLAVLRSVRVIATASPRNHELLRSFGAEPVTYGDGLASRVRDLAPGGITAAADLVGSDEALTVSLELVGDRERIASIANFTGAPAAGVRVLDGSDDEGRAIRRAARSTLADLAGAGRLKVVVAARYPLAEVAAAHRQVQDGHTVGKIVLQP